MVFPKVSLRIPKRLPTPWTVLALSLAAAVTVSRIELPGIELTYVAVLVALVLAVVVDLSRRAQAIGQTDELLAIPLTLARDQQFLDLYRSMSSSMRDISFHFDPIFKDLAVHRLQDINADLHDIAHGHIVFVGTETWRTAYERLLRSRGLHLYRSVAYLKTASYWQNEPGRRSMDANYAACNGGNLDIHRIAVIPDPFWPAGERLPMEPVATWIDEQHRHGISVFLLRLSELSGEPDLVSDFGIYGNRAVGTQELDEQGRTTRFTLSFDFPEVLAAEQRWERLSIYATSYRQLLDRSGPSA